MKCLIIGLGIYGSNLAKDLTDSGNEVIGADIRPTLVEAVKDYISTVYIADSTDEAALCALPISGVDLVIVAIGENFGASIKTVALLKKLGVKRIFARAVDEIHQAILEGLQVERIITPEQRAAFDLTQEMSLGDTTRVLRITNDASVIEFPVPDSMAGEPYSSLEISSEYGLSVIAATRTSQRRNLLGISARTPRILDLSDPALTVEKGDRITCFGSIADFRRLAKAIAAG
ncbi:MAG: TrkA family potassium uptake protein [Muribaculaceae bacterium]|nr:TrkA family potassium uptake protein [Muribaculaceae bacterium]MDE5959034.1 TrkA family potassium uptake protein [Muribaculaceae bacterium]MDE6462187.1 TrkA family potassium uptake protein [Muribaculaceae bacterium]MDE6509217.1 TrkA family potassium uptake protein [Muribaculaceae bacterium]